MSKDVSFTQGRFVWRELMTTDPDRSLGFYGKLAGWSFEQVSMSAEPYWLAKLGSGHHFAGIMRQPKESKAPPFWAGYVSTPDLEAATERAKASGGKLFVELMDIPEVGRFSMVQDPTGAVLVLFRGSKGDMPRTGTPPGLGEFCWESLCTTDVDAAVKFYTHVVGWQTGKFGDGPTFTTGEGMENAVADVQPAPPGAPSGWLSYLVVKDLEASVALVRELGGTVLVAEIAVPTIGRWAVVQDNVGAIICPFVPEQR